MVLKGATFNAEQIRTIRIQIEKKILGFRNMQEKLENMITDPTTGDHAAQLDPNFYA